MIAVYFGRWEEEYVAPYCCALEDVARALRQRGSRNRAKKMEDEARFIAAHKNLFENRKWTEEYSENKLKWCALWRMRERYMRGDL